ncbi:MAG: hypothetical protein BWX71_02471 [Deltaproteobacteria bacterium ADurb.Bin072]|nr:MAG: hypothetical protein BWX71_02471 [Deltaproteobacteria bacterium ADurb.Bin072]
MMPVSRPSQKLTVTGPEMTPIIFTIALRPPERSMTSTRTVTPQTIMMTPQGMALTPALLSAALSSMRMPARMKATEPTFAIRGRMTLGMRSFTPGRAGAMTKMIRRRMATRVYHCFDVKGSGLGASSSILIAWPCCLAIQAQPPISRKPPILTNPWQYMELKWIFQAKPSRVQLSWMAGSWGAILAMMPLEMMPVGAKGEKAAPLAAPTTRSVIRKAGMPTRVAIAMATGAMRAVAAIFPGPIVVRMDTRT